MATMSARNYFVEIPLAILFYASYLIAAAGPFFVLVSLITGVLTKDKNSRKRLIIFSILLLFPTLLAWLFMIYTFSGAFK